MDDKLIMGYLAQGNSVLDLLEMLVKYMPQDEKDKIIADIKELDKEDEGAPEMFMGIYEQLCEVGNSPAWG